MSLTDWQRNFGLLAAQPIDTPLRLEGDLSPSEHAWLSDMVGSPCDAVTRLQQRRLRRSRLADGARLTLAATSRHGGSKLVDDYFERFATPSSYAALEVLRFLDFARERTNDALVACVARFERAIVDAAEERSRQSEAAQPRAIPDDAMLRLHPWRVVVMPARTEEVIVSVALGEAIAVYDRTPVIIGPGLPTLWREASRAEDVLCSWLVRPRAMGDVTRVFPGLEAIATGLMDLGVVSCMLN